MNRANEIQYVDADRINWHTVEQYLKKQIPDIEDKYIQVQKFSEGYSNLTYMLKIGEWEGILRRPPFGKIPPRAHDMQREFHILQKLNPVFQLAPKPYVYCEDQAIMDKHFYVMEKKQGVVIDKQLPSSFGETLKAGPLIAEAKIKTLVELQSLNYIDVGLKDFGKPEGFLRRQVTGWIKRYEKCQTDTLRHVHEVEQWLLANIPDNDEVTIVHNDFKLNNLVFHPTNPSIVTGVLDWELSTIGDPLMDLGASVVYWGQPGDLDMGINIVTDQSGFYNRREFIESYANQSKRDVTHIEYYVALGFYKLAVILQQIYYRWKIGELKDERFRELNKSISNLIEMANLARNKMLF